jgi:23S rRNA (uracil1939-C5)-methyltransferase
VSSTNLVGSLHELLIEKLTMGGDGLGHLEGMAIFVPFAAPGDLLKVRITQSKKKFCRAEIVAILQPGPSRVNPPCPQFGICGGCHLQHLSYSAQIAQKELILKESLRGCLSKSTEWLPFQASPNPLHYRNRIQIKVDSSGRLGFFAQNTHDLVPAENCLIAKKQINLALLQNRRSLSGPSEYELSLTQSTSGDETVSLTKRGESTNFFTQVNSEVNSLIEKTLLAWLADEEFSFVIELFAGNGNFSIPILKRFKQISLVSGELSAPSVAAALKLAQSQNMSALRYRPLAIDCTSLVRSLSPPEGNVIFLDPPRSGLDLALIQYLPKLKPSRLFYLSCNPATLARDLQILLKELPAKAYIHRVQGFDMFPQTYHMECLVEVRIDSILGSDIV